MFVRRQARGVAGNSRQIGVESPDFPRLLM